MWICPVCGMRLHAAGRQLVCEHGHSFDRAKQGYVNLLPAQRKRSVSPGDDKFMIASRRDFLERGYYKPLVERLCALCVETMNAVAGGFAVLDTGCGEGWYTCAIADALHASAQGRSLWIGGIDIAKHAVAMAARRCGGVDFAVASNVSIPLADASLDCMLRIFAPGYDDETLRVLKPGGLAIIVTPGPRHLFALRERVYDQAREHEVAINQLSGLCHRKRIALEFGMRVQQGDIEKLLRMTPYFWKASGERQQQISAMKTLETEACFVIDVFRREVHP